MQRGYFNFSSLIKKYMVDFTAITYTAVPSQQPGNTEDNNKGYYNDEGEWVEEQPVKTMGYDDSGEWVQGEPIKYELRGAIISFRESKIYRAEGTLTAKDKRLFMLEPLPEALAGAVVIYEGSKYNIDNTTDNSKFTGVWAYTLKYNSAFNESEALL